MTRPGILEHAILVIRPGREAAFETAFETAGSIISRMPGFQSLTLSRGIESAHTYLLLVRWDSVADHEIGFRESPDYQRWRAMLHDFYDPFPTVQHFDETMNIGVES